MKSFWFFTLLVGVGGSCLAGCSPREKREYESGLSHEKNKKFREAQGEFLNAILLNPTSAVANLAAKEGARVSLYELHDYKKAIQFERQVVFSSADSAERIEAQKKIVNIYFENLTDYKNTVKEADQLLAVLTDLVDISDLKVISAKAYYYLNDFNQAENEIDEFLKVYPKDQRQFDLILLKGNINLAQKDSGKAITTFKSLIEKFPDRAKKANVALMLSICYEEVGDYKSAKEVLETMRAYHPVPEYIDLRIKKINERLKNQPGAKGFRK